MGRIADSTARSTHVYEPAEGYALAAASYEAWHWFRFWQRNEVHLVQEWAAAQLPGTILDAGSGTGLYRCILEQLGYFIVGVDVSADMLRLQAQRNPGAPLVQASLLSLPFRSLSFDSVLCTRVLSHIENIQRVFGEFARVTDSSANLFIADVHPEHRYSEMSIPTPGTTVSIQTYKHPIQGIHHAVESSGFELVNFKEFYLEDLAWKPPKENFENIYDEPKRPVFYTCSLRRL